jgi:hypothetical protein
MSGAETSKDRQLADLQGCEAFVGASWTTAQLPTDQKSVGGSLSSASFVFDSNNYVPTAQANQSPDPAAVEAQQLHDLSQGVANLARYLSDIKNALSRYLSEAAMKEGFASLDENVQAIREGVTVLGSELEEATMFTPSPAKVEQLKTLIKAISKHLASVAENFKNFKGDKAEAGQQEASSLQEILNSLANGPSLNPQKKSVVEPVDPFTPAFATENITTRHLRFSETASAATETWEQMASRAERLQRDDQFNGIVTSSVQRPLPLDRKLTKLSNLSIIEYLQDTLGGHLEAVAQDNRKQVELENKWELLRQAAENKELSESQLARVRQKMSDTATQLEALEQGESLGILHAALRKTCGGLRFQDPQDKDNPLVQALLDVSIPSTTDPIPHLSSITELLLASGATEKKWGLVCFIHPITGNQIEITPQSKHGLDATVTIYDNNGAQIISDRIWNHNLVELVEHFIATGSAPVQKAKITDWQVSGELKQANQTAQEQSTSKSNKAIEFFESLLQKEKLSIRKTPVRDRQFQSNRTTYHLRINRADCIPEVSAFFDSAKLCWTLLSGDSRQTGRTTLEAISLVIGFLSNKANTPDEALPFEGTNQAADVTLASDGVSNGATNPVVIPPVQYASIQNLEEAAPATTHETARPQPPRRRRWLNRFLEILGQ